ncbi:MULTISPECIES: hypothetical protein [unclassified Bradyrhizobium]|uniref:hypothetical protein n=1 Tax=unclassified Bradyrhizobium TaxID=2631580 RepID=UPI001FFB9BC6|nr:MULTISPECIES: hypothetical protein [unclassified Bradyrhizobium]
MHVPGRRGRLDGLKSTHIDQITLLKQAGKMSHEHICQSLELFGREVMPELQNVRRRRRGNRPQGTARSSWRKSIRRSFTGRCGKLAINVAAGKAAAG